MREAAIGFSKNSRGRIEGQYLARADELVYAGAVEQGFGADDLTELEKQLRPIATRREPFVAVPSRPPTLRLGKGDLSQHPRLNPIVDLGFLRHPSFEDPPTSRSKFERWLLEGQRHRLSRFLSHCIPL